MFCPVGEAGIGGAIGYGTGKLASEQILLVLYEAVHPKNSILL